LILRSRKRKKEVAEGRGGRVVGYTPDAGKKRKGE